MRGYGRGAQVWRGMTNTKLPLEAEVGTGRE